MGSVGCDFFNQRVSNSVNWGVPPYYPMVYEDVMLFGKDFAVFAQLQICAGE
jgi:hypothetical protein